MSEINLQDLGERSLKNEENIMKRILIKGLNQEDPSEELKTLQETSKRSNAIIQRVMDSEEEVDSSHLLLRDAIRTFQKYHELKEQEESMREEYSVEKETEYSLNRINFAIEYYTFSGMIDRLLCYYGSEEEKPDLEKVLNVLLERKHNVIPLRNTLLGIDYRMAIRDKDFVFIPQAAFLRTRIDMELLHMMTMLNMELLLAVYRKEDVSAKASAILLTMKLAISTLKDLSKEYGLELKKETLAKLIGTEKEDLLKFPQIVDYPELLTELEHLEENADKISTMYNQAGQK